MTYSLRVGLIHNNCYYMKKYFNKNKNTYNIINDLDKKHINYELNKELILMLKDVFMNSFVLNISMETLDFICMIKYNQNWVYDETLFEIFYINWLLTLSKDAFYFDKYLDLTSQKKDELIREHNYVLFDKWYKDLDNLKLNILRMRYNERY